jgi:hypothetical protein
MTAAKWCDSVADQMSAMAWLRFKAANFEQQHGKYPDAMNINIRLATALCRELSQQSELQLSRFRSPMFFYNEMLEKQLKIYNITIYVTPPFIKGSDVT